MENEPLSPAERLESCKEVEKISFASKEQRQFQDMNIRDHFEENRDRFYEEVDESLKIELLAGLSAVVSFVNGPIVEDNHENHTERREWRKLVADIDFEVSELLESNRLRLNNMWKVVSVFKMHKMFGVESTFWADETEKLWDDLKSYNGKDLSEKKEIVETLTKLSRSFYERVVENL